MVKGISGQAVLALLVLGIGSASSAAPARAVRQADSKQVCRDLTQFNTLNYVALGEKLRESAREAVLCQALVERRPDLCQIVDPSTRRGARKQGEGTDSMCEESYAILSLGVAALRQDPRFIQICHDSFRRMNVFMVDQLDKVCSLYISGARGTASSASVCGQLAAYVTPKGKAEFSQACPNAFLFQRGPKACAQLKELSPRADCKELAIFAAALTAKSAVPCGASPSCQALFSNNAAPCLKKQKEVVASYCEARESKANKGGDVSEP